MLINEEYLKEENIRIDKYLSDTYNESRSNVARSIDSGKITVNASKIKASYKLKKSDLIYGEIEKEKVVLSGQDIPLDIVFEDESFMVINKPFNMVVHPSLSTKSHTLVNALLNYTNNLSDFGEPERRGIVHRLDKDTTGLIIVAKDNKTHEKFKKMFQERQIEKKYLAIVHGKPKEEFSRINIPIGRDRKNRTKMSDKTDNPREAITDYHVLDSNGKYSLLELNLLTGRTHQIRVHLSLLKHPVLGDKLYGRKKEEFSLSHQMLHAHQINFDHPITNKEILICQKPDSHFMKLLKIIGLRCSYNE